MTRSKPHSARRLLMGVAIPAVACVFAGSADLAQLPGGVPTPEFLGTYAFDGSRMVPLSDGRSTGSVASRRVEVVTLGSSQALVETFIELPNGVRFLVYDPSPTDAASRLTVHRLPLVRNIVTRADPMAQALGARQPARQALPLNRAGRLRVASMDSTLLQKPVDGNPQLIELVPESPLAPGLYGILSAPPSGTNARMGQKGGWVKFIAIGPESTALSGNNCIDLVRTGGLGGMFDQSDQMMGNVAVFPLIDSSFYTSCGTTGASLSNNVVEGSAPAPTALTAGDAKCEGRDDCVALGRADIYRRQWSGALSALSKASQFAPDDPGVHLLLGELYLTTLNAAQATAAWDRVLDLGGALTFSACRERLTSCDQGTLTVQNGRVEFSVRSGVVFSAAAAGIAIKAERRELDPQTPWFRLNFKVGGKNYNVAYQPSGVTCMGLVRGVAACQEPGYSQQRVVTDYLVTKIPKL